MSDEIEGLLDFKEVEGFKVRPWGLSQLARLAPCLERIVDRVFARGLSLKNISTEKEVKAWLTQNGKDLIFIFLPEMPEIVSVSLGIGTAEIDAIPQGKVLPLVMTIITQNVQHLKNWLGPIKEKAAEVIG